MINLNNLKTGRKLALGFGATALMMVVGTVLALYCTITINRDMQVAMQEAAMMNRTKDIDTELDTLYLEMWGLVSAKDTAKRQASLAAVESHRQQYRKHLDELKAAEKSEPGQRLLDRLEEALVGARDANQRITDLVLKSEGQNLKVLEQFEAEAARQMQDKIDPALEAMLEWRQQRLDELDAHAQATVQRAEWFLIAGLLVGLACAIALGWLITRSIVVPIHEAVRLTGRLADGDFSAEVSAASRARGDEMGDLARAFHAMVDNTRKLLQEVAAGVQTLASSSTEFTAVASQTAHAVRTMSEKTASVAAAAEEASANTTSVAASMEQAAANLSSVASATEEMSATVGEIAANSEKARAISEQATAQAQTISALMQQLGQAAREIGKVTETITDISSQTNLLALNATIEAARAGAAGKGFAVVANEIKELARQTAAATEDIKAKISGMQTSTGSAITDIEKISGVIQEVSAIVSSIAASIEEQATVTKDVAANIAQASAGVNDSNERVAQTATVSKDIARDMAGVNVAVGDIREGGEQLSASTAELSKLAEQLKETADHFQV